MPAMFLISGFLFKSDAPNAMTKLVKRMAVPFLIFYSAYHGFVYIAHGLSIDAHAKQLTLSQFLLSIPAHAKGPLWFLQLSIHLRIISIASRKFSERYHHYIASAFFAGISTYFYYTDPDIAIMPLCFGFANFSKQYKNATNLSASLQLLPLTVAYLTFIISDLNWTIRFLSALVYLASGVIIFKIAAKYIPSTIYQIGSASLGFYLFHTYIQIATKQGIKILHPPSSSATAALFGFTCTIAATYITCHFVSKSKFRWLIGK